MDVSGGFESFSGSLGLVLTPMRSQSTEISGRLDETNVGSVASLVAMEYCRIYKDCTYHNCLADSTYKVVGDLGDSGACTTACEGPGCATSRPAARWPSKLICTTLSGKPRHIPKSHRIPVERPYFVDFSCIPGWLKVTLAGLGWRRGGIWRSAQTPFA